jgi:hypothetical protein
MGIIRWSALVVFAFFASASGASLQGVSAQSSGAETTITIHARMCPDGYVGDDLYGDCHNFIITGQGFTWSGPDGESSGQTGSDGNLTFAIAANSPVVYQPHALPDSRYVVFCSASDGAEIVPFSYDSSLGRGVVFADLTEFSDIICDWYTIPEAADHYDVFVAALYCSEVPSGGNNADVCDIAPDVTIDLTTAGGTFLGSCVTVANNFEGSPFSSCTIEAPFDTDVVAAVNLSTLAEGYAPADSSIEYHVPATRPDGIDSPLLFFLVPISPEPEPTVALAPDVPKGTVTALPSTGVVSGDGFPFLMPIVELLAAVALGTLGLRASAVAKRL